MQFDRTAKQRTSSIISLGIASVLAMWVLYMGWTGGRRGMLIFGAVLAFWAGFVLCNLIRRTNYGALNKDGIRLRYLTHDKHITWEQMQWSDIPEASQGGMIGYCPTPGDKVRYAAFSQRLLGPEAVDAIKQALTRERPDMPTVSPHTRSAK